MAAPRGVRHTCWQRAGRGPAPAGGRPTEHACRVIGAREGAWRDTNACPPHRAAEINASGLILSRNQPVRGCRLVAQHADTTGRVGGVGWLPRRCTSEQKGGNQYASLVQATGRRDRAPQQSGAGGQRRHRRQRPETGGGLRRASGHHTSHPLCLRQHGHRQHPDDDGDRHLQAGLHPDLLEAGRAIGAARCPPAGAALIHPAASTVSW